MATTFFDGAVRLRTDNNNIIRRYGAPGTSRGEFYIDDAIARKGDLQPICRCDLLEQRSQQNIGISRAVLIERTGEVRLLSFESDIGVGMRQRISAKSLILNRDGEAVCSLLHRLPAQQKP